MGDIMINIIHKTKRYIVQGKWNLVHKYINILLFLCNKHHHCIEVHYARSYKHFINKH